MKFDPTTIHNTVKKIQQQSMDLDELSDELKVKCNKKTCKKEFPQNNEVEKSNLGLEEL